MVIGVIRETDHDNRVVLTPEVVKSLVSAGVQVLVEKGAGERAMIADTEYTDAGAQTDNKNNIFEKADLLLKINPLTEEELRKLKENKVVLAAFSPFVNKTLVKELARKKITSFSMELVPRITRAQSMDILSSMATVAGYKAVLDAAMHLPKFFPMFMSAAGTIKPAKVLILGAGVAGLQAIAVARKLGAVVESDRL